jgi:hypothetical protein
LWRRRRTLKCESYRLSDLITRLRKSECTFMATKVHLRFALKVESVRLRGSPLEHPSYAYSLRTNLVRTLTYREGYKRSSWCNYRQLWYPLVGSAIQTAPVIYPALCARRLLAHAAFTFCYPLGIYRRGLSPGRFLDLTNVSSFTRLSVRTV